MTLIPITEKTQICFVHCGKEVCKCNTSKNVPNSINEVRKIVRNEFKGFINLDEDIKEIISLKISRK